MTPIRYIITMPHPRHEEEGDECIATELEFTPAGGVVFYNNGQFVIAYAPGEWGQVFPAE